MKTSTKPTLRRLLGALLASSALTLTASAHPLHGDADAVAQRLRESYPGTRFGELHATAWPGVYEVGIGNNIAYVDDSGQYFLFGHLYDMKAQRDLTAERQDARNRIDFSMLPLHDAITEVRGNGARTLAVFSDPDCPYCRRLDAELASLTDITLHTFLMPVASLHPEARRKAIAVWCVTDRVRAWSDLLQRDITPEAEPCAHPVDRTLALAERLGIQGTPTLIAGDGRLLPGAASAQQINAWLDGTTPPQSSPVAGEQP